jgi:hypothetical protein
MPIPKQDECDHLVGLATHDEGACIATQRCLAGFRCDYEFEPFNFCPICGARLDPPPSEAAIAFWESDDANS